MSLTGKKQLKNSRSGSWSAALEDAKRKLSEGRYYVSQMRKTVRIIEDKLAKREPWPSSQEVKSADHS
jgi:hypothetical protein